MKSLNVGIAILMMLLLGACSFSFGPPRPPVAQASSIQCVPVGQNVVRGSVSADVGPVGAEVYAGVNVRYNGGCPQGYNAVQVQQPLGPCERALAVMQSQEAFNQYGGGNGNGVTTRNTRSQVNEVNGRVSYGCQGNGGGESVEVMGEPILPRGFTRNPQNSGGNNER